jgi:hypothetical protein
LSSEVYPATKQDERKGQKFGRRVWEKKKRQRGGKMGKYSADEFYLSVMDHDNYSGK